MGGEVGFDDLQTVGGVVLGVGAGLHAAGGTDDHAWSERSLPMRLGSRRVWAGLDSRNSLWLPLASQALVQASSWLTITAMTVFTTTTG